MTLRECAEAWRLAAPHGPTMSHTVKRALELHVYPTFGDLSLSAIRPSAVQAWVSGLPLTSASATVVVNLSSVFRSAVRDRLVASNPCDGVRVPPTRKKPAWIPDLVKVTTDALAGYRAQVAIDDRSDPRNPVTRTAPLRFTTAAPGPMTRSLWSQIWRPAAKAAGFPPRARLHALRHFYASALIRHGERVKTVQKRWGHSSTAMTLDTYAHLWPDSDDPDPAGCGRALTKIDSAADRR